MSKADISTTPILPRRAVLAGIASAAVIPTATWAATPVADPIFAAIEAYRQADAACVAVDGEIPDEVLDRWSAAISVVQRTRPTTPAGLAALTSFARERSEWFIANGSVRSDEEEREIFAAIDDATRGMSGLAPWSPPLPVAVASTPVRPHPDAKLIELGIEYERLWAIEEPLGEKTERLLNAVNRLHIEKLGIDPEDKEACFAAVTARYSEWMETREDPDAEVGYNKAWSKFNRASKKTAKVGKKILKLMPTTMAGLLVRIRVIETHDALLDCEPEEQLVAEIRNFAKRAALQS